MGDSAAFKPVKPGARISEDVEAGPRANRPAPAGHVSRHHPGGGLLQQVQDVLRAPGQPLSAPVRQEMEARFGADFSGVRLHADTAARASAAAVGARAYTSGDHVVLGSAAADGPALAHELDHVIQQREGPVSGVDDGSGLVVSDPSDRFERAAEAAARHAVRGTLPRPGDDAADGRLLQAHRPTWPGAFTGSPPVPAVRTSAPAPDQEALRGGQPLRGGPAHAAVDAPLPIQRLKVNGRAVDIASLSTREAKEYSAYLTNPGSTPRDVVIEHGDAEALAEALSIKGRIDALAAQIAGNIPRIVVEDKAAGRFETQNPRPSEQSITFLTKEHLAARQKQQGPFQIWSGKEGGKHATHSAGYTLAHTPGHFQAEAMAEAAEGPADPSERDPAYHLEFAKWLEQDITQGDLTAAGLNIVPHTFGANGSLKKRTFLLGHPLGLGYVEGELGRRRDAALQAKAEAAKGSALEVSPGFGQPVGEFDELSQGTSKVVNRSKWSGILTGNEQALIGLHDANFQSAWGLVSERAAVGAVRSFTPVASHGIPSHPTPEATIQYQFEIPAIKKEAGRQQAEINELVELLRGHPGAGDSEKTAAGELQQGIADYVRGAELLSIDPSLPKSDTPGDIPFKRQHEDENRMQSAEYMSQGRKQIQTALNRLKNSQIYKK